jgi:hypothetical protein
MIHSDNRCSAFGHFVFDVLLLVPYIKQEGRETTSSLLQQAVVITLPHYIHVLVHHRFYNVH